MRIHHNTELALVKFTADPLMVSDGGFISVLVLLDFSAGFAIVDHDILLQRFQHTIAISIVLQWFESYLSNRFNIFQIKRKSSSHTKINYEVPQGSVLRSILFTLYMPPLGSIIRSDL